MALAVQNADGSFRITNGKLQYLYAGHDGEDYVPNGVHHVEMEEEAKLGDIEGFGTGDARYSDHCADNELRMKFVEEMTAGATDTICYVLCAYDAFVAVTLCRHCTSVHSLLLSQFSTILSVLDHREYSHSI